MSERPPYSQNRPRVDQPRASARTVGVLVVCALVLTFGAVFYVWQRYQYIKLGFEVNNLRREKARMEEIIDPLEVEAAYLSSPARLEALARELGLKEPKPAQVVVVDEKPMEEDESLTPVD